MVPSRLDSPQARPIDLRSDAITTPTDSMWEAMRAADLGWASAGQDTLLVELEETVAKLAGKEKALYVLTGGMANLVALMTHTRRGDQVVLDSRSHILWCEEWGLSYICGLTARSVDGVRGQISPDAVVDAINDSLYRHRPRTSLLCLENPDNTFGEAADVGYVASVSNVAHELGASVHLDGARVLNACAALDVELHDMLAPVDSAMISLNKGLSAPGGAILVGTAEFISEARMNVRRLGGSSFHQCGIHAAAALVAFREMLPQLAEDNRRAAALAEALRHVTGVTVDQGRAPTNMVIVAPDPGLMSARGFVDGLETHGVLGYISGENTVRFVTHRHIDDDDIAHAAEAAAAVAESFAASNAKQPAIGT